MRNVTEYAAAISALKYSHFKNDRITGDFKKIELNGLPEEGLVKEFFLNWLMYMDGPKHQAKRHLFQQSVRTVPIPGTLHLKITERAGIKFLDNGSIIAAAKEFHKKWMGLSQDQYTVFEAEVPHILKIIHEKLDTSNIVCAARSIQVLRDILTNETPCGGFLKEVSHLIESDIDTILNIIIDSLEPILCAFTILTFEWLKNTPSFDSPSSVNYWLEDVLRQHPPFRYISRVDTFIGERVAIHVASCNLDVERGFGLSFGYGAHTCLGKRVSLMACRSLVFELIELGKRFDFRNLSGEIETNGGVTRMNEFAVTLDKK